MITVIKKPTVTIVSKPQFLEPVHLPCDWEGEEGSDGARLTEYAGRVCYLSYHNPARRSSAEYIENIRSQKHGSVLEHANYSLLLEGISRSCSHELVRHRAGFAYSQQSQRYVDETACAFVMPPLIQDVAVAQPHWIAAMEAAQTAYQELSNNLLFHVSQGETAISARKIAREAARSALPNATETKIVATANLRAWRHMLEMRANIAADREIRALAIEILRVLTEACPEAFDDFEIDGDGLGGLCAHAKHRKV